MNEEQESDEFQKLYTETTGEPTEKERLEQLAKDRNLADATEMLTYANTTKKLELPTLGYHVEYMPLRIEDGLEIKGIQHDNPEIQADLRNRKKVHLILHRADKRWTEQVVNDLAAVIIDAILMEYDSAEDNRFLWPITRRRLAGLRQTMKPNASSS